MQMKLKSFLSVVLGLVLTAICALSQVEVESSQSVNNSLDSTTGNLSCPIWTTAQSQEMNNETLQCTCVSSSSAVYCDQDTLSVNVYVKFYYCITYSSVFKKPVLGHCWYNIKTTPTNLPIYRNYWKLPSGLDGNNNTTNITTALCQYPKECSRNHGRNCTYYQHQTGLMCTSCVEGYAYPVYSFSIDCVKCTDYKYNWLKYIAVAFLPLTVFYILVVLFRINASSGALNGYIFMCQVIATPFMARSLFRVGAFPSQITIIRLFFAFVGVWNLDFFRALYPPFCLHPQLTTLQTLMLDYVVAVYPLLLVILTYIFVKLHNRYSFVVWLWSPFYKCFALFRNKWDINRSLVGAFATFLLLSYVKILNVSVYALIPNTFHDAEGNIMSKRFLYYDATYEYFGTDHIPYALLAVFMIFVFNIFPLVLLCLYPCRCFQRCLNCCNLSCLTLHIFMDTFHGCYKLQPRDCRYFAATYLFLRILNHCFMALTRGPSYVFLACVVANLMVVVLVVIAPYKKSFQTSIDTIFFVILSILFMGMSSNEVIQEFEFHMNYRHLLFYGVAVLVTLPVVVYGTGLLVFIVVPKKLWVKFKTCLECLKVTIKRRLAGSAAVAEAEEQLPYRFYHSEEYPPLLLPSKAN